MTIESEIAKLKSAQTSMLQESSLRGEYTQGILDARKNADSARRREIAGIAIRAVQEFTNDNKISFAGDVQKIRADGSWYAQFVDPVLDTDGKWSGLIIEMGSLQLEEIGLTRSSVYIHLSNGDECVVRGSDEGDIVIKNESRRKEKIEAEIAKGIISPQIRTELVTWSAFNFRSLPRTARM